MNRRVLILHGWGGSDAPHWQAELACEAARNYGTVSFPLLDNCHFPSKNRWMRQVKTIVNDFNPDVVVCHSLANTLWLWLCEEGEIEEVGNLYMVAPPSLHTREETIRTFFPAPLPASLKAGSAAMIVSDNDPYITADEAKMIAAHFQIPLTIIENAGHFNVESGYGKWDYIEKLVLEKE